jgi:hypothetical protein
MWSVSVPGAEISGLLPSVDDSMDQPVLVDALASAPPLLAVLWDVDEAWRLVQLVARMKAYVEPHASATTIVGVVWAVDVGSKPGNPVTRIEKPSRIGPWWHTSWWVDEKGWTGEAIVLLQADGQLGRR